MPIQAAANKLKHEIETYGCPPVFPGFLLFFFEITLLSPLHSFLAEAQQMRRVLPTQRRLPYS